MRGDITCHPSAPAKPNSVPSRRDVNLTNTAFYCKLRTMFDNRAKQVPGWQLTYVLSDMCGDITCQSPAPAKPNDIPSRRDVKPGKYRISWQAAHNSWQPRKASSWVAAHIPALWHAW